MTKNQPGSRLPARRILLFVFSITLLPCFVGARCACDTCVCIFKVLPDGSSEINRIDCSEVFKDGSNVPFYIWSGDGCIQYADYPIHKEVELIFNKANWKELTADTFGRLQCPTANQTITLRMNNCQIRTVHLRLRW